MVRGRFGRDGGGVGGGGERVIFGDGDGDGIGRATGRTTEAH